METDVVYLSHRQKFGLFCTFYWKYMLLIIVPIVLLPIMSQNKWTPPYRCMYIICIMAIYWITEALPLPITSMIPMLVFPPLGILDGMSTCSMYMNGTVAMFVGGLIIAIAIEYCNLHKRIALRTIQLFGCSTARLSLGLQYVTMFWSFWISNTAVTAMMCPIVEAVLEELETEGMCKLFEIIKEEDGTETKQPTNISKCFFLGEAYASTIGGIGTLIGSGTNLTFKGIFESRFPEAGPINFASWTFFCGPIAIICTFVTWVWLQFLYMGLWRPNSMASKEATIGPEGEAIALQIIKQRQKELGPMSTHEKTLLLFFILAIVLFLTQKPGFVPGWNDLFKTDIPEYVPAMLIVLLIFIFPVNYAFLKFCCYNDVESLPKSKTPHLLTWRVVQNKFPWGLMLLLGAGFALAEGGRESGMSKLIGQALVGLESLSKIFVLFLVCLTSAIFTQFTVNVPIANILLPIFAEVALAIKVHPFYLMLPCALSCGWAFQTAVGTPPNAIVAGYGNISSRDFGLGGIGPAVITLLTTWLGFPTWGSIIYPETAKFPDWAKKEAE